MSALSAVIRGHFTAGISAAVALAGILAYVGFYTMFLYALPGDKNENRKEKERRKIAGILCAAAALPVLCAPIF